MSSPFVLEAKDLCKTFPGSPPLEVLKGISLQIKAGESLAIMGKSGEGKSTLLHILGTLDTAQSGTLYLNGETFSKKELARLRNQRIGFIFQSYYLLEEFTVLDNVLMPMKIGRDQRSSLEEIGLSLLKEVGLEDKAPILAKYLSGGEKQRVSIARALCNQPDLILADEPTGNLDQGYSKEIQDLLLSKAKQFNTALIVVTHDQEFADRCDLVLSLKGGQLYNREI